MADTMRGDFGDTPCSDCGKRGEVYLQHWGPLVQPGANGFFDGPCFLMRRFDSEEGKSPVPLGASRPAYLRLAAEIAVNQGVTIRPVLDEALLAYTAQLKKNKKRKK